MLNALQLMLFVCHLVSLVSHLVLYPTVFLFYILSAEG